MAHEISLRAEYAKRLLYNHVMQKYNSRHDLSRDDRDLSSRPKSDAASDAPKRKICIIGAGTAGLQVAMALLYCGFSDIDIFEAEDIVGGRARTIQFPVDPEHDCPHNYYDAGAMRIPKIPAMESMLHMVKWLGLEDLLVDYTYNAGNEPSMYLYQHDYNIDNTTFDDNIAPRVAPFFKDFNKAFEAFVSGTLDNLSTRMWLMTGCGMSYGETIVAETADTSTGLFDQALLETILDYSDFHYSDPQATVKTLVPWYRIEGGMFEVPKTMYQNSRIQSITGLVDNGESMTVQFAGGATASYNAVFNTTTMGCLSQMDLSGLKVPNTWTLDQNPLTAIRTLSYDRATKVAIKFKEPWWSNGNPSIPNGGVSSTDLPISNVIYPSWNDGKETAHVIIVSYSWAQDATRMASLMTPDSITGGYFPNDPIAELCFKNLADLWQGRPSVEDLRGLYMGHHVTAWSHEPNTAGAFALFAPGQFKNLYTQFTKPLCENKLMICGEAISAHHAWISGALDSAYNAVLAWFLANDWHHLAKNLRDSPFGCGQGRHTQEVDEEVLYRHVKTQEVKR